jgi:hypothetical protein
MALVPLLTVHGHVHHVDGASAMLGGPRGSPFCLRVPHVPRARRKCTTRARARRRDVARDAYHARDLSARLERDRFCSSRLERLTCYQCFFGPLVVGRFYHTCRVPYFYPLMGTLGILIPDSSP